MAFDIRSTYRFWNCILFTQYTFHCMLSVDKKYIENLSSALWMILYKNHNENKAIFTHELKGKSNDEYVMPLRVCICLLSEIKSSFYASVAMRSVVDRRWRSWLNQCRYCMFLITATYQSRSSLSSSILDTVKNRLAIDSPWTQRGSIPGQVNKENKQKNCFGYGCAGPDWNRCLVPRT